MYYCIALNKKLNQVFTDNWYWYRYCESQLLLTSEDYFNIYRVHFLYAICFISCKFWSAYFLVVVMKPPLPYCVDMILNIEPYRLVHDSSRSTRVEIAHTHVSVSEVMWRLQTHPGLVVKHGEEVHGVIIILLSQRATTITHTDHFNVRERRNQTQNMYHTTHLSVVMVSVSVFLQYRSSLSLIIFFLAWSSRFKLESFTCKEQRHMWTSF